MLLQQLGTSCLQGASLGSWMCCDIALLTCLLSLQCFSSVVGPNGSGKSNVIDAMLFVFGKRAKQVRPSLCAVPRPSRSCKRILEDQLLCARSLLRPHALSRMTLRPISQLGGSDSASFLVSCCELSIPAAAQQGL